MYATADDMRARYGEEVLVQLTDQDSWGAGVVAAINVKLADATALADGYVAKYHQQTATATVPPLLVRIVCDIAFADLARAPTEEAIERRREAMRQLRDISTGLIKLDEGKGDLPGRAGQVLVPDRQRTFSRDTLGGF